MTQPHRLAINLDISPITVNFFDVDPRTGWNERQLRQIGIADPVAFIVQIAAGKTASGCGFLAVFGRAVLVRLRIGIFAADEHRKSECYGQPTKMAKNELFIHVTV
jgi:hypothetical protein